MATSEFSCAVRAAIRGVLRQFDIPDNRVEDYEPFVGNVSYDLVQEMFDHPAADERGVSDGH
jgi:hypothetical protein